MLMDWDRLGARTSLEFYPLCELVSCYTSSGSSVDPLGTTLEFRPQCQLGSCLGGNGFSFEEERQKNPVEEMTLDRVTGTILDYRFGVGYFSWSRGIKKIPAYSKALAMKEV
ncbi:hypothetical protein AVEN_138591-1 [Araneus ventricosus]|uniref:Uncharacterized protein n=1 Tax=Araneus ventricosus TaxID=182803 RepID=A0A4Y2TAC8_ARAVE|nr:hypothetical protein AVEN_138591-1 [Araneus ventricosus]